MPRRHTGTSNPKRARRSIVLLVLASITIISLDYRGELNGTVNTARRYAHEAFSPLQSSTDDLLRPVGSFVGGIFHYQTVVKENAKLNKELQALQAKQATVNDLRQRIAVLSKLDDLPWVGTMSTVPAEVTSSNPSDFASTVDLGTGSASGIEVGMPVVSTAGLYGQVIEVWSDGCTVRLIDDANSSVGVSFGTNYALANGKGAGATLEVDNVAPGTQLSKGTLLVTSGLDNEAFPAGIPVARVTSASTVASADQETVTAQPLTSLSQVQYVDVVQWVQP